MDTISSSPSSPHNLETSDFYEHFSFKTVKSPKYWFEIIFRCFFSIARLFGPRYTCGPMFDISFAESSRKKNLRRKKTQTLEYSVELSGAENYKTNKMPSLNWDSTSIYVLLSRINMSHIYQNICPVSIIYIFDRLWGGINSQSLEDTQVEYTSH